MTSRKVFYLFLILFPIKIFAQHPSHPSIMLTKQNLPAVIKGISQYPLLKKSFADVKQLADKAISNPINVPVPKDGGGGITHEQHKLNYQSILACGVVYQVTKEKKYAE